MNSELKSLFLKAVRSVDPARLIKSTLRRNSNNLIVRDRFFALNHNCYLIGFGKAVYEMATEVERIVGGHLREGIISVPAGSTTSAGRSGSLSSAVSIFEGAEHNLPDEKSFEAARQIGRLANKCANGDLLLVLISGGGSALLPYPIAPVTLDEKTEVIRLLASAGADIVELNSVRRALSELKGGKLALLAYPATVVSFILSDVVGDPLDFIASGPTVSPYMSSSPAALTVLERYRLLGKISENVKQVLRSDDKFLRQAGVAAQRNVHNVIIGNNVTCLTAAKEEMSRRSCTESVVLTNRVVGSVAEVTDVYSKLIEHICLYLHDGAETNLLCALQKLKTQYSNTYVEDIAENLINYRREHPSRLTSCKHLVLLCGGEPTVEIKGWGKGGRNQELSLRVALALQKLKTRCEWMDKFDIYFMSAGTDGIDGPTDAAGAIVNSYFVDQAVSENLNPETFLENNDAYTFFSEFDRGSNLIKIGHTGTNVMDIHVIVISWK